jgi:SAM-dependent methyltransferase
MTSNQSFSGIHNAVERYYTGKITEHGATPRGVDWKDRGSHDLRHHQFLRLIDNDAGASIGDLGCGFGDFLGYMRRHGHTGDFIGYDLSDAMLDAAREKHGESDHIRWIRSSAPTEKTDYVTASGLFNVRGDFDDETWRGYLFETLDGMANAARKAFAFNVLSLHSDPEFRRPDLFYANPAEMLETCARRYSRHVAILQDTRLYEFTLMVRLSID